MAYDKDIFSFIVNEINENNLFCEKIIEQLIKVIINMD